MKETAIPERKTHGRSKAGVELTDDVLEQMAKEAEEGLEVTKLRRRPGRPAMGSAPADSFPVRLEPELLVGYVADDTGRPTKGRRWDKDV